MDKDNYNIYTISDSDNESDIIKDNQKNTNSQEDNDLLSSEEEPEFFYQVIEQRKRKKSPSPEMTGNHVNVYPSQSDFQGTCVIVEDPEPIYEPIEPKPKKRLTKEEMEQRKKDEKARNDAKKKMTEELKRLNPKECMKYMTIHIDSNLQNQDFTEDLLSQVKSSDAKFKVESNSIVKNSVTWSRQTSDNVSEDENFMVLIWDFDDIKYLIEADQLIEKINYLKTHKEQLSLIIYSARDRTKKTKSKKHVRLTESDLVKNLEELMLNCHVSFRFAFDKKEVGLTILYFTKSIAEKPFQFIKFKEEQEEFGWCTRGFLKYSKTVNKNGTGKTQLWRQMLSQFPLCTLEASEAIASKYESPTELLEAYEKCSSKFEGETLLQDIPVRRGFGPLVSNRRIGPELSKKIYTFLTDNTGCTTLSQE